jgi:two-component system chemotaxis response regulator CheB
VAPGAGSLIVRREGATLRVDILPPQPDDRYVPSVNRMLTSCATAMQAELCAIVLTGMGGDGGPGVKAVKAAGGRTIAEAPETAVIFGMPQEAIATGAVDDVVPLPNIPERIARFAQKK